jgi:hypothetical protein
MRHVKEISTQLLYSKYSEHEEDSEGYKVERRGGVGQKEIKAC